MRIPAERVENTKWPASASGARRSTQVAPVGTSVLALHCPTHLREVACGGCRSPLSAVAQRRRPGSPAPERSSLGAAGRITLPGVAAGLDICSKFSVAGLGVSRQGRKLGVSVRELRLEALELALADSGLVRRDIDGHIGASSSGMFDDIRHLGLAPRFSYSMQSGGATATLSIVSAIGAILTGQAEIVACLVRGHAVELGAERGGCLAARTGARCSRRSATARTAYGYPNMYGMVGAGAAHALHARRHMERYGTTSLHLGAVAVQQREYASVRPGTIGYGQPITIDDHQSSRMVVDPFRLLDCCRDTDGAVVVIVTTTERALRSRGSARTRARHGDGAQHAELVDGRRVRPPRRHRAGEGDRVRAGRDHASTTSTSPRCTTRSRSRRSCSSRRTGSAAPGEGGPFVAAGQHAARRRDPDQHRAAVSCRGFYATGFTALVEGVWQIRGEGGADAGGRRRGGVGERARRQRRGPEHVGPRHDGAGHRPVSAPLIAAMRPTADPAVPGRARRPRRPVLGRVRAPRVPRAPLRRVRSRVLAGLELPRPRDARRCSGSRRPAPARCSPTPSSTTRTTPDSPTGCPTRSRSCSSTKARSSTPTSSSATLVTCTSGMRVEGRVRRRRRRPRRSHTSARIAALKTETQEENRGTIDGPLRVRDHPHRRSTTTASCASR